jgi:hypothetical protein
MELTDCGGGSRVVRGLFGGKSIFPNCYWRLDLLAEKIEVSFIPSSRFLDK